MNGLGYAVLFGSIPATLLLFALLPARRAATTAMVLAYLFLPRATVDLPMLPDVSVSTAIGVGLLLGILLLDPHRMRATRFGMRDLPLVIWCLTPIASSISNQLGVYDGVAEALKSLLTYGVPYLAGRLYVTSSKGMATLARTIVIGGLVYAPLCWIEIRMSPQLNNTVYGFTQHAFYQTLRFGGWRPMVFLDHGIAVGVWMMSATVAGLGLWLAGRLPAVLRAPPWLIVVGLGLTTVFCKSTGAIALLVVGAAALVTSWTYRTRFPLFMLVLLAPAYLTATIVFDWDAGTLTEGAQSVDESRAASLQIRVETDRVLRQHALERPWFGWGGWDRFRGGKQVAPDSLSGIVLGQHGLVGLCSFFGMLVLVQLLALKRVQATLDGIRAYQEVTVLVVILALYTIDCTLNAMLCPVHMAIAGGLATWSSEHRPWTGQRSYT